MGCSLAGLPITIIEGISGFSDDSTIAGESWLFVKSEIEPIRSQIEYI